MNNSYLPIGGALLIALKKNYSKSLPLTPESKVFDSRFEDTDHLHAIGWDNGEELITIDTHNGIRYPIAGSKKIGINDISRIKTLVGIKNNTIRLHQAVKMIPLWSNYMNNKPIGIESWMIPPSENSLELFLDIESEYNNTVRLSREEKRNLISTIESLSDKDIGLYKVAAPVDSMPLDIGDGKHLAFIISDINVIERVL